jgi:hypothetical protein
MAVWHNLKTSLWLSAAGLCDCDTLTVRTTLLIASSMLTNFTTSNHSDFSLCTKHMISYSTSMTKPVLLFTLHYITLHPLRNVLHEEEHFCSVWHNIYWCNQIYRIKRQHDSAFVLLCCPCGISIYGTFCWPRISIYGTFCWPRISIYACNETNLRHHSSAVYSVTVPLHVLGLLVAHHQEVTVYICGNWCVSPANSQLRRTTRTNLSHIYIITSWWWVTSKPEKCRGIVTE